MVGCRGQACWQSNATRAAVIRMRAMPMGYLLKGEGTQANGSTTCTQGNRWKSASRV